MAKTMPRASTRNLKSIPGSMVNRLHSIVPPARMVGAIDATMENLIMAAINETASLVFGFLFNTRIKKAAVSETSTAKSGLIELIVSNVYPFRLVVSSALTTPLFLTRAINMPSPTAASAAAMVITNIANT